MNDIIVGIGEVLWDVFPEGKRIGGAPANFAYHMLQFGFDSRVVSAVGEDVLGNEILENFNGKGLRYWVERVSFPTGIVEVTLDGEGIPCYEIKQGGITCRILRNLIDWLVRLVVFVLGLWLNGMW